MAKALERFRYHSEPSGPENKMRELLDSLGVPYEYQLPVRSGFVLDFAFREQKKAIEVDGYYHQFTEERDKFRDRVLARAGWKILRIDADDLEAKVTRTRIKEFLTIP